jgi:hypothetical protein
VIFTRRIACSAGAVRQKFLTFSILRALRRIGIGIIV